MKHKKFIIVLAAVLLLGGLNGCEKEGPAERAGEKIDETVEQAGEQLEKAGDKAQEATQK